MPGNSPIHLLHSQIPQAAEVLADAFQDDPMYIQVQPDETKRRGMLARLFIKVVRYALHDGQVYTTPAMDGVACWLPPGHTHLTVLGLLGSGLVTAPLAMGLDAYRRFDRYMSYSDKLHAQYAPPSHWYLWAIGVAPACQGRGIGSRLLQPVLTQADVEHTACYLDTGTTRNARFYQKQGFEVMEQGRTPRDGVLVWAMLRPPGTV